MWVLCRAVCCSFVHSLGRRENLLTESILFRSGRVKRLSPSSGLPASAVAARGIPKVIALLLILVLLVEFASWRCYHVVIISFNAFTHLFSWYVCEYNDYNESRRISRRRRCCCLRAFSGECVSVS